MGILTFSSDRPVVPSLLIDDGEKLGFVFDPNVGQKVAEREGNWRIAYFPV